MLLVIEALFKSTFEYTKLREISMAGLFFKKEVLKIKKAGTHIGIPAFSFKRRR